MRPAAASRVAAFAGYVTESASSNSLMDAPNVLGVEPGTGRTLWPLRSASTTSRVHHNAVGVALVVGTMVARPTLRGMGLPLQIAKAAQPLPGIRQSVSRHPSTNALA